MTNEHLRPAPKLPFPVLLLPVGLAVGLKIAALRSVNARESMDYSLDGQSLHKRLHDLTVILVLNRAHHLLTIC